MSASERRATLTKGSTGIHLSQNEEEDIFLTSSKYASGMAFNSQMFPAMLAQLYHNPSWLKFIKFFFSQDSDNAFIVVHESIPESIYKAAHVAGENNRYISSSLTLPFPQLSLMVMLSHWIIYQVAIQSTRIYLNTSAIEIVFHWGYIDSWMSFPFGDTFSPTLPP